jgi:curli biogenesis system outer membrane secretion channel CsgG
MRRLWILAVFLLPTILFAGVEVLSVTTKGQGKSMAEALNVALLQAVAQINGKTIESESAQANYRASGEYKRDTHVDASGSARGQINGQKVDNQLSLKVDGSVNDKASLTSDAYMQIIKERTGGAVLSYVISSSSRDDDGIWTVVAISHIAKFERSAEAKRKRVAIVPFRSAMGGANYNGQHMSQQEIARQLSQTLSSHLVQSAKFTVLDRDYESELGSEVAKIQSENVAKDDYARLGQKLITDYLLVGTIDDFRFTRNEKKMQMSGQTIVTNGAIAVVSFRLVEAATGQAIMSDNVRVSLGHDALQAKGKAASNDMLEQIGEVISAKIVDQVYPPLVIAVQGREVVIGQGGNAFREGDLIKLYRVGKELFDPYTKESLGRHESFCCTVRIMRVTPKSSYAEVQESGIDLATGFKPGDLLVRERVKQKYGPMKSAGSKKNPELTRSASAMQDEKKDVIPSEKDGESW